MVENIKPEKHVHSFKKVSNSQVQCTDPKCGKVKYRSDLTHEQREKLGFQKAFAVIQFNNRKPTEAMLVNKEKGKITVTYFSDGEKTHATGTEALKVLKKFGLVKKA